MHPEQALLVTGGTGSFGKTMLRRVLDLPEAEAPGKVIIFSRDEEKQFHQRQEFPDTRVEYFIGDVRDRESCVKALKNVDIVIHAAALKQVPTGEFFPSQMVKTNVLGTENMLEAAEAQGVQKFINLSTDKAVYPINAYGMSKALAEKIVAAAAGKNMASGSGTVFCTVRYGNVMGSRGSVIPLFLDQLKEGDTVTLTDGSMTRFLLKLEQATDLVRHAIEHGTQGRMYIRKTPGCTVDVLIEALELHFNRSIEKTIIGVRPGEKIHETLITADELSRNLEEEDAFGTETITAIRSYFECKMVPDPVVYDKFDEQMPAPESDFTSNDTQLLDPAETLQLIKEAGIL
jgi:UDP-glucose 4-epimerase